MKEKILDAIYNFFVNSNDFNGIPLRRISRNFDIEYSESIDLIKELVEEDKVSIQSSPNPHIIYDKHYPTDIQLKILDDAKSSKVTVREIAGIKLESEDTESPICLYPSPEYLKTKRNLDHFENAIYAKQLALGEPQLTPVFFDIDVLERYVNDPRFDFKFKDYSGRIYCKYDENDNPVVREEDNIFLKTFGLGFDAENGRLAVVYLRYLKDLTSEHQVYWKSKEKKGACKILAEYHENTINGNWTSSCSVFTAFINELKCLNELSEIIFGKPLFLKNFDGDRRPKEFTFFFTPTLKNYNDFVLLLDKMISDNINKNFFDGEVELFDYLTLDDGFVERKAKGTIRLFEEWLLDQYETDKQEVLKDLFKPLKKIRRERQNPAHRISENEYDKKYIDLQKELINSAWESTRAFRHIFQQHPSAKEYKLPNSVAKGRVKTF